MKESRLLLEDQNDDTAVPDVLGCVQEILSTIFVSMYNHHDAEERCYSDCLSELPEHDIIEGRKVKFWTRTSQSLGILANTLI